MNKTSKIYIAGHRGLVGSAIVNNLTCKGYTNLIYRTHAELDLTNQQAVAEFFETEKPEYVILAAAKVGGIVATTRIEQTSSMKISRFKTISSIKVIFIK